MPLLALQLTDAQLLCPGLLSDLLAVFNVFAAAKVSEQLNTLLFPFQISRSPYFVSQPLLTKTLRMCVTAHICIITQSCIIPPPIPMDTGYYNPTPESYTNFQGIKQVQRTKFLSKLPLPNQAEIRCRGPHGPTNNLQNANIIQISPQ